MRQIQGPRDLPWARRQLLHLFERHREDDEGMMSRGLRLADLYWVTPAMTELALDAALDIPEWTMAAARPCSSGLVMWAGKLPQVRSTRGQPFRPTGLFWWTRPGCVGILLLCPAEAVSPGIDSSRLVSPIGPAWGADFAMHGEPIPIMGNPREWRGVIALLGATWHLMMEPKLAERTALPQPRKDHLTSQREGISMSDISVVDLRALRHVEIDRSGESQRHLTHRHYVRGHWRRQWMPSTSSHEPRFIAPYIKGPAGTPLLAKERVMVWRR